MPQICETDLEQEPAGIIISRGSRAEATPRFVAYVWAQVEEPETPGPTGQKAA